MRWKPARFSLYIVWVIRREMLQKDKERVQFSRVNCAAEKNLNSHSLPWFTPPVILRVVASRPAHHASHITLMSVADCAGQSWGEEAPVASSAGVWGLKSNGVVSCVDGPHVGFLLTLPRHFNWVCKTLNGQNTLLVGFYDFWGRAGKTPPQGQRWSRSNCWEGDRAVGQYWGITGGWAVWTGLCWWGTNHSLSCYQRMGMLSTT